MSETNQEILDRREMARKERERKKKGDLAIKGIKYSYAAPIIKFERRMFGWHYEGKQRDTIDQGYEATVYDSGHVSVRHKVKIIKTVWFSRPKVWPKNVLFVITEILSKIFSFFRRIVVSFFPVPIIIGIILLASGAGEDAFKTFLLIVLPIYGGLIFGSIILALLGFLWRKVFKLEDKCDQILLDNGYATWSENEEGDHF